MVDTVHAEAANLFPATALRAAACAAVLTLSIKSHDGYLLMLLERQILIVVDHCKIIGRARRIADGLLGHGTGSGRCGRGGAVAAGPAA